MAVWLVRAGRSGEGEDYALKEGVAAIGWCNVGDLAMVRSKDDIERLLRQRNPEKGVGTTRSWAAQIWTFVTRIKDHDLIVLPLKRRSAIAVGEVVGPYQYRPQAPPIVCQARPVKWIRDDIPRSDFDQDLLDSFGAFMTVCQIQRNNAEERIRGLVLGRPVAPPTKQDETTDEAAEVEGRIDFEQSSVDQIRKYIGTKFREHDLTRLVEAILKAQGYTTLMSPAGPDGGVDIVAGKGAMGFDPPRLCVQVKSQNDPADVKIFRELQGVLKPFGADQGLLVCWGGFKRSVFEEARRLYFAIRLWDADDVIRGVTDHYEQLPEELQAQLPLKRIWALVPQE